jgi:hypothetical protein
MYSLLAFLHSGRYSGQILMKLEFSRQIFEKKLIYIKFHENPSRGSRVVPRGKTERQTNMTKLIFAFRNFANEPKNNIFMFDAPKMASSLSFLLPFSGNF